MTNKKPDTKDLNYEVLLAEYSFNTLIDDDNSIKKYFSKLDEEEQKILIYMLEGESILRIAHGLNIPKKELKEKYNEILNKLKNMYLNDLH